MRKLNDKLHEDLNEPLPDGVVKNRDGYDYLPTWYVFETANRIFGPASWGYNVISTNRIRKGSTSSGTPAEMWGATVEVEVHTHDPVTGEVITVRRTDYGASENYGQDAEATAIKGAISDGVKRCFRGFGPQFGNKLYDKDRHRRSGGGQGGQSRSGGRSQGPPPQRSSSNSNGRNSGRSTSGGASAGQVGAIKNLLRQRSQDNKTPSDEAIVKAINAKVDGVTRTLGSLDELTTEEAAATISHIQSS